MLQNRRCFVECNNKTSRFQLSRNGLPRGSVLAPLLYNIYTNDFHTTCQDTCFDQVEETFSNEPNQLKKYYKINKLGANPLKTQICDFHPKNRYAKKKLNIIWDGQQLQHCNNSPYLSVTLDHSLTSYVTPTKAKVSTRDNFLRIDFLS